MICGSIVPKGRGLCERCRKEYTIMGEEAGAKEAAALQDVVDVLSVANDSDGNIKRSIEALLRIAGRMEGSRKAWAKK